MPIPSETHLAWDERNPFTMVDATSENNRTTIPPIQHPLANDSDNNEEKKRKERRWALALFSVTTLLLFADQNLMSPNLTGKILDLQSWQQIQSSIFIYS